MDITLATFCKNHKIVLEEWELDLVSTSAFSSTFIYVKVFQKWLQIFAQETRWFVRDTYERFMKTKSLFGGVHKSCFHYGASAVST